MEETTTLHFCTQCRLYNVGRLLIPNYESVYTDSVQYTFNDVKKIEVYDLKKSSSIFIKQTSNHF